MKKTAMFLVIAFMAAWASAFPSWMGVVDGYQRHNGANPGVFNIFMNENNPGLKAEIGIKIGDGSWVMYPMGFVGFRNGNGQWQYQHPMAFPDNAKVQYFFHGYDGMGENIWDSALGANYSFTAAAGAGGVTFGAAQALGRMPQDAKVYGDRAFVVVDGALNRGLLQNGGMSWGGWSNSCGKAAAISADGAVVVAAEVFETTVRIWRSIDRGQSFTSRDFVQPELLERVAIVARPNGSFVVAFGKRLGNYPIYPTTRAIWTMRSLDNGLTWSAPAKAVEYGESNSPMIRGPWEFHANAEQFFLSYHVLFGGAAHTVQYVLNSSDGLAWSNSVIAGGKYFSGGDLAVSPAGAVAGGGEAYSPRMSLKVWNGTEWAGLLNSPTAPHNGAPACLNIDDQGGLFAYRRGPDATGGVYDVWFSADDGQSWSTVGTVLAPKTGDFTYAQPLHGFFGAGIASILWSDGYWQTSRSSCPGLQWVGNTWSWPAPGNLSSQDDLWINTESWQKGAGQSAVVVYKAGSGNWNAAPMPRHGDAGNNDWWHANLGKFLPGTTIEYAVAVIDCGGLYKWDSSNGQNYKITVKSAQPLYWVGNTYHWPFNGQITKDKDIWVNTESWPTGAGVSALLVYSLDNGATWKSASLNKYGTLGNNDAWHLNLGKFAAGTIVRYALMVQDANGKQIWNNNDGKDYRAVVNP